MCFLTLHPPFFIKITPFSVLLASEKSTNFALRNPKPKTRKPMNQRLRYIDAMRGLAIWLVVFSHVTNAYLKMPITNASFEGVYYMMTMFRMPLFFFVSGFFAFRMAEKWTWPTVKRVMTKKFQAQIVGLTVFCFLYGVCIRRWKFHFL